MPDGSAGHRFSAPPAWPLVLAERTAAAMCDMSLRDFRACIAAGLLPRGRTVADMAATGLLPAEVAARLSGLGLVLWHRAELEERWAHLWGLEGQAVAGQADARRTALDALDAYDPASPRQPRRRAASPVRG